MVRKYVPKRTPHKNKGKRMANAVQLRGQGLSLRKIASELRVDEKTVRNDLARWEAERGNVTPLRISAAEICPGPGGEIPHPDSAPADVIQLRRTS